MDTLVGRDPIDHIRRRIGADILREINVRVREEIAPQTVNPLVSNQKAGCEHQRAKPKLSDDLQTQHRLTCAGSRNDM